MVTAGQENPLTGWDLTFKSFRIELDKGTYQATNTISGGTELFGVRGRLPFDREFSIWAWEIQVNSVPSVTEKSIYGVSTTFAQISVPFNLPTISSGTVYQNDGTIFGTGKTFEPLSNGDILTFILDYENKFLAVGHNGTFQGLMLDPTNFIINNDLFPYFATNTDENGVLLRDGTPIIVSSSDKYCLFDPAGSETPLDISFTHDPLNILKQFQQNVSHRPYYYAADPYSFFNISQDNELSNVQEAVLNIPSMLSPLVREDLVPVFWSIENTAFNVNLTNNNLTASGVNIGTARANRPATFGKIYWEYDIVSGSNGVSVGISTLDDGIHDQFIGRDNKSWGFSSGAIQHNNISTPVTETIVNGDRINISIDIDNGLLWIGINGVYINGGNPATGFNPTFTDVVGHIYPAVSSRINTGWEVTGRFIRTATALPPSGFINIDGTAGATDLGRPNVTWNENTATSGDLIFDATVIADNNNGNTLSEGNLRVRFNGNTQSYTFGTRSHISGKKYVEFQIIDNDDTTLSTFIGLSTLPIDNNDILSTTPEKNIIYIGSSSTIDHIRSNFGTDNIEPSEFITGDVVQMAVDFDCGKLWFGLNGIWSSGDPGLGTSPTWQGTLNTDYFYAIMGDQSATSDGELKANFGASLYTFSIPNGFSTWDEPSIAAWDESRKPTQVTLINNNLNADGGAGLYSGLSSYGRESGKHYFEIEVITTGTLIGNTAMTGIGRFNTNENAFLGSDINSWSIWQLNGSTFNNNTVNNAGTINWLNVGDIVHVAVDMNSGSMWFGVNGVWLDGSDPSTDFKPRYTNISGMVFPAYSNDSVGFGDMGELQIGLVEPFIHSIPIGYKAWDIGVVTVGGMIIDSSKLTATGNGSVVATHFVNKSDTKQFYMEFDLDAVSDVTGIGLEISDPSSTVAHRFWRIKSTSLEDQVDINEIEMFESSEGGTDVTNQSFAIFDSEFSNDFLASFAFNNTFSVSDSITPGVRWVSDTSIRVTRYIGQDFGVGNEKNIKRITIKGGIDSAISWDLQHSDDGILWTSVKTNIFVPFNVTVISDAGDVENIERILYQNTGALGPLNQGQTATFDPLKSSSTWQFFSDNVQVADIGFEGMSQATRSVNSGKVYWEVRIEPPTDVSAAILGFTPIGADVNTFPGQVVGVGFHAGTGDLWVDGMRFSFSTPFGVGDVINFSLDLDLGNAWIGVNGVSTFGDPETGIDPLITGVTGDFFAAVGDFTNTVTETVAYTANFGQFIYLNTVPADFDDYGPVAGDGTFVTYTTDDVIGIAVDASTREIWWSKNNEFIQGSAITDIDPLATLSGNMRIIFETLNGSITANFGADFFEQNRFRSFEQFGCGDGGFRNTPSITWNDGTGILRDQNLRYIQNGSGSRTISEALGNTKKRYLEFTITGTPLNAFFGILDNLIYFNGSLCVGNVNFCGPVDQPLLQDGDVVMISINEITGKGWFGINGIWFNNGFPEIDNNETLLISSGEEIVFGVVPSGNLNIIVNMGTVDFIHPIPFGFEPYDTSITAGLTLPCVEAPDLPLLQTQGFTGHALSLVIISPIISIKNDFETAIIQHETVIDKILNETPLLTDLFPNQTINVINIEQYMLSQILHSISTDVVVTDQNHAPFAGEIPFLDLIVGTNIEEGVDHSIIFIPRTADIISTPTSLLRFSNIDISSIYDYASHLQGHDFEVVIMPIAQTHGKPHWPLPSEFNLITGIETSFTSIFSIDHAEREIISTPSIPDSSIPVFGDIEFINTISFEHDFTQRGFALPEDLLDAISVGTKLHRGADAVRTIFLTPIFPEKSSGRLQGG